MKRMPLSVFGLETFRETETGEESLAWIHIIRAPEAHLMTL